MIIKSFELKKINLSKNRFILFYGKNNGFIKSSLKNLIQDKENIFNYEEKEIIDNTSNFFASLSSGSLFEKEKIIIVKRVTDKIHKIIEEIIQKKYDSVVFILLSDNLEKKSKLRSLFEKDKLCIAVAFYPDDLQTLIKLTNIFLREKEISISPENINLIISKCNGDREILIKELEKIEFYCKGEKKIDSEKISKLINLSENYSIAELIDNCLAKNKKKIINILNENNFNNEDGISIIRTFLNKSKKLQKLSENFKKNKNIELAISSAKPPIFWKDKEITKEQIYKWSPENIKDLTYKINELELIIKKSSNNSLNLITDFILEQASNNTNN